MSVLTALIYLILGVAVAATLLRLLSRAVAKPRVGSEAAASRAAAAYTTRAQIADYHRSVYQATGEDVVTYLRRLEAEARQHGVKYSHYYEDTAVLANVPGGWAANHLSDFDRKVLY